jgi:hypothetical protein
VQVGLGYIEGHTMFFLVGSHVLGALEFFKVFVICASNMPKAFPRQVESF